MFLCFVRHGQTDWNDQRRIQGQTDIPLNEKGRQQAEQAAKVLCQFRTERIVSSPLSRAYETASIIAAACRREGHFPAQGRIETDSAFLERRFGEAEGVTIPDMKERFASAPIPGYEDNEQAAARAVPAVDRIVRETPEDGHVVIVTHSAITKVILRALTGCDSSHLGTLMVPCGISLLCARVREKDIEYTLLGANMAPEKALPVLKKYVSGKEGW